MHRRRQPTRPARSSRTANVACPGKRRHAAAISRLPGPERRTTPKPPRPNGVEMATMVSRRFIRWPMANVDGAGRALAAGGRFPPRECPPYGRSPPRCPSDHARSTASAIARARRHRRSGRRRHIRRHYDHRAARSDAHAFAAQFLFVSQCQMDHPSLAAGHRVEMKGHVRAFHLVCRRQRAHAEFFHAQQAVIVCVERNQRMIFGRKPQRLHREMFQRQQQLCPIGQQKINVFAGEPDRYLRVLYFRVRILSRMQTRKQSQSPRAAIAAPETDPAAAATIRRYTSCVSTFRRSFYRSLGRRCWPAAGADWLGINRLIINCCAIPDKVSG